MPYIKQADRDRVNFSQAENAGELNYLITNSLIKGVRSGDFPMMRFDVQRHIINYLGGQVSLRYQHINDVLGAIYGALKEYERRMGPISLDVYTVMGEVVKYTYTTVAAPYEDLKIKENGDIPEYAERNAQ